VVKHSCIVGSLKKIKKK